MNNSGSASNQQSHPAGSPSVRVSPANWPPAEQAPLTILRVPQWLRQPWTHGFSTRGGGVSCGESGENALNLGYTAADTPSRILANRQKYLAELIGQTHRSSRSLLTLKQMHSSVVRKVTRTDAAETVTMWGDGMVTDDPALLLGILTADCFPILLADRKLKVIGALHAGWRGTLKGIAGRGVEAMQKHFGSRPQEITAAIGPGIGSCCFSVGAEILQQFSGKFSYAGELFSTGDQRNLDLGRANQRQLIDAGVPEDQIFSLNQCTSCQTDRFFSYRAESGKTGRMMAVIGLAVDDRG